MFLCFLHDVPIIVYNNDDFPAGGDGQPDKKKEDSQLDKTHKTCNTKSYVDDDSICGASPPRASQVVCPSTVIHAGLESVSLLNLLPFFFRKSHLHLTRGACSHF